MAGLDEDRILIEEILAGNTEAFGVLIRKYQKPVFYMVQRMLRRQEDSDDVTQKAFVQAYTNLSKFRFESSFKTWLITIALNLARNQLRRNDRFPVELNDQISDGKTERYFEISQQEEDKKWLQGVLEELPPTQKEVITLRIYEELPFKDIAKAVGSSEGTAKVNFHHGMKRLREVYEKRNKKDGF